MKRLFYFIPVLLIFVACNSSNVGGNNVAPKKIASSFCNAPQKITAIFKDYVYDLNGYEGVAGGTPFNLFDENAASDPKARVGPNDYHPVSSPHPVMTSSFYYPVKRGNRIVVDLRVAYKLSELYLYDMSRESDSVWIYTGDMKNWKLSATLFTKGDIAQFGWRKLTITDSTRYVMIRFNSWLANITEAVFYGCPYGKVPSAPAQQYAGPRLAPKTLKEFLGINTYQGVPIRWMKPFYNTRLYTPADHIDRDSTNEYPNQLFNLSAQGWWNGGVQDYTFYADSIARYANAKIWYSVLGVPYWLKKQGFDDRDRPITKVGMDKEDPMSYARHANMFWTMAALYGNNKIDTNQIAVYNSPKFSGRNVMSLYENGNEVDANWVGDKYCNPIEYFAVSSADYDGHEGKLGKKAGIKNADPAAELMMAGMAGLDTNRLRILDFLCKNLRTDQQFLWKGGIQYHCYSVNGKGRFPGEAFAYATGGASPEEDSLRHRLSQVRNYSYKIQPGVECVLGEYGYDKNRASKVSAPLVKGYDAKQSQGIMLVRGINAVSFSGFDKLILYWIKDDYGPDEKSFFLTCGVINHVGQDKYEPYPSWYYISTLINHLGDYTPYQVVSEKGNVWIYKYRSKSDPAAFAYFLYCPTYNGTKVDNYSLAVGSRATGSATEISLADNAEYGVQSSRSISNGKVVVNVTESPKFILVREK